MTTTDKPKLTFEDFADKPKLAFQDVISQTLGSHHYTHKLTHRFYSLFARDVIERAKENAQAQECIPSVSLGA